MTAKPLRKRQRVSSHALYQNMSVLLWRGDRLEKDVFQGDRRNVYRRWIERTRFGDDRVCARARTNAEDAALSTDTLHAGCAERCPGRVAFKDELHSAETLPQVVERAADDRAAAVDDPDVVRDLIDFRDLMGREEYRHAAIGDMADQRLQHLLGHRRIEARGWLVEDQQVGAAAEGEEQCELRPRAAGELLDLSMKRQLERSEIVLLEILAPAREEAGGEPDHLLDGHRPVQVLVGAHESGTAPNFDARLGAVHRETEHAGVSAGGPSHPEQNLDGGCLASAVSTQEAKDRSRRHAQVQSAQGIGGVVPLLQACRFNRERVSHGLLLWSAGQRPLEWNGFLRVRPRRDDGFPHP